MRVAVTGGSGFVGSKLVAALAAGGHEAVSVTRGSRPAPVAAAADARVDLDDEAGLRSAFAGCEAVVHLAGINRSRGAQTFERVHVEGTRNVVAAAQAAGARRLVLLSFLQARPGCGSRYHETKWEAERMVTASGLDSTVLKAGVLFGPGDGMVTNLARSLRRLPVFAKVGLAEATVRPVWVGDVVTILLAAAVEGRLSSTIVPVVGPEEIPVSEAARRVAQALGRPLLVVPLPVALHYALGWLGERLMRDPIVSVAQVRMLAEGISRPLPAAAQGLSELPEDLRPSTPFDRRRVLEALAV